MFVEIKWCQRRRRSTSRDLTHLMSRGSRWEHLHAAKRVCGRKWTGGEVITGLCWGRGKHQRVTSLCIYIYILQHRKWQRHFWHHIVYSFMHHCLVDDKWATAANWMVNLKNTMCVCCVKHFLAAQMTYWHECYYLRLSGMLIITVIPLGHQM